MTTEERLLKLDNAVLTLSELSVKADARIDRLEKNFSLLEKNFSVLEKNFRILTELAVSANERMDTHTEWINKLGTAQANLEVKVGALTDAQIRTEESLRSLGEAQKRTEESLAALTKRVDKLADTVERHIEGHNGRA